MSENLDCSICGSTIGTDSNGWSGGNNAEPINDGRCCHLCDCMIVIPIRLMDSEQIKNGILTIARSTSGAWYEHHAKIGISILLQRMKIKEKTP